MKFGLFAARGVGLDIARFFGESQEPLACLILDSKEDENFNSQIIDASKISTDRIFYSSQLYTQETLIQLSSMEIDLLILAWWPYIIKKSLIKIPKKGCLNFHPSYLPFNRGKHYNFWSIVEDVPFGVTLHFVDPGVDTGDIAYQVRIDKSWEDTGETLYFKAQETIVKLFKDKFAEINSGKISRTSQDANEGSFHTGKEIEAASQIDLDKLYTARELLNLLRARTFKPHPGAWFIDDGAKYEVRVEIVRTD